MNFDRLIVFLILILFLGLSLYYFKNAEQDVSLSSTHTTALCYGQTCRDFVVKCLDNSVIELTPISGFVTFGDDWVDRRIEKELC